MNVGTRIPFFISKVKRLTDSVKYAWKFKTLRCSEWEWKETAHGNTRDNQSFMLSDVYWAFILAI